MQNVQWSIHVYIVLALLLVAFQASAEPERANVLMIVVDDLGWHDTGYQGAEYSTPTIDKLAAEGVRLRQYYVQAICTPSRSALMAGRYPYHLRLAHGVIGDGCPYGLDLSEITLAEQMKKAGYATHAVGKCQ